MVKDLCIGEVMLFVEVMQIFKIDLIVVKSLFDVLDKFLLYEMIQKGQLNFDKGYFILSDKFRLIMIQEVMD